MLYLSLFYFDLMKDGPSTSGLKSQKVNKHSPSGVELDSLISEVKDILPDLGDGFVKVCVSISFPTYETQSILFFSYHCFKFYSYYIYSVAWITSIIRVRL